MSRRLLTGIESEAALQTLVRHLRESLAHADIGSPRGPRKTMIQVNFVERAEARKEVFTMATASVPAVPDANGPFTEAGR